MHFIRINQQQEVNAVPSLLKYACIGLAIILIFAVLGVLITQRVSDGPIEFLRGGPIKTGECVEEAVTEGSFGTDKHRLLDRRLS